MTPAVQFWTLQTALPALGLALVIGGVHLRQPWLFDGGLFALGTAAALSGLACIVWRRVVFLQRAFSFGFKLIVYRGGAALCVGAALIALGVALAAAGLAHASGTSAAALREAIMARPGLALAPLGFVLLAIGMAVLIGFAQERDAGASAAWNLLMSLPDRLGGLILSIIGGAALLAGLYELLDPQAFDRSLDALRLGALR